eukprot:3262656-Prymnesium_polylepis.2
MRVESTPRTLRDRKSSCFWLAAVEHAPYNTDDTPHRNPLPSPRGESFGVEYAETRERATARRGKRGYDTVKIDVTQTPRSTRPTTAIPVRAEEVGDQGARITMARKPQRAAAPAGKLERLRAPIQPALHPA